MFTLFLKSTPPNNTYRPKHCHHTTVNNCQQSICLDSYDLHECKFRSNEFSGCCRLSTKQFPMSCHRGNHNDHDKSDHNLGGCWGRRGLNGSRFVVVCYQTFLNEAIPSRYREGIYQWWWGDTTNYDTGRTLQNFKRFMLDEMFLRDKCFKKLLS